MGGLVYFQLLPISFQFVSDVFYGLFDVQVEREESKVVSYVVCTPPLVWPWS